MMLSRDRFFSLNAFSTSIAFLHTVTRHDTLDNSIHAVRFFLLHFQFLFSTVSYMLSYNVRILYRLHTNNHLLMKWRLWIANCMLIQSTHKSAIFICAHTSDELHQITTLYETKVYFIDRWQPKEEVKE